jgi:serine/threonine protein phosphatase PrpC
MGDARRSIGWRGWRSNGGVIRFQDLGGAVRSQTWQKCHTQADNTRSQPHPRWVFATPAPTITSMIKAFRLIASTGIHKGDREYQQDQVALISHERFNGCVLGVVADGMGGRSGGRKASDQVMMTARQLFERYSPETDDPAAMLKNMVQEAHIVIRLTAISSEQEPHSTIAAFLINPRGDCHWVHAGDSRIYHFEGARLTFRTSDHS